MKILSTMIGCLALIAMLSGSLNAQDKGTQTKSTKTVAMEKATFVLKGVECEKCSSTLSKILTEDGVKLEGALKPSKELSNVVVESPLTLDISSLVSKIQEAQTPHRDKFAPALMVAVFNEMKGQKADEVNAAIKKISALDAKATTYNEKTGEINLAFTGKTKITLADLMTQLKTSGLKVKFTQHTS